MPTIPVKKLVAGVNENGDFLVLYVESSRHGHEPHRVDLQKFCGHGQCDCEDFCVALRASDGTKTKRQMMIDGAIPHASLECKHIRRAKRYLLQKVLNRIIEDRDIEANENKQKAKGGSTVAHRVPETSSGVRPSVPNREARAIGWSGGKTPFAKKPVTQVEQGENEWGPPE